MSAKYMGLLGVIVLTAANNKIYFGEDGAEIQVTIPVGRYFLRGDGDASCILTAIKTAVEAAFANTYTISVAFSVDASAVSGVVTFARTAGTATFQILWADVLTTFDPALLGFTAVDTADNAAAKAGTLSPSCVWISPEVPVFLEPGAEQDATAKRARSGRVRGIVVGDELHDRTCTLEYVDARRVWHWENVTDPTASLWKFIRRQAGGRSFEIHLTTVTSSALDALSAATEIGAEWHFDTDTVKRFDPKRMDTGLNFYEFPLGMLGYVAA